LGYLEIGIEWQINWKGLRASRHNTAINENEFECAILKLENPYYYYPSLPTFPISLFLELITK